MVLVVCLVAAAGSGLTIIAGNAQSESAVVLQRQRAAQSAQLISDYLSQAADRLKLFLQIEDLTSKPPAFLRQRLERLLLASLPLYSQIAYLDRQGLEIAKVSRFHSFLPGELTNRAGEEFFSIASAGKGYLGPMRISSDSGLLALWLALPAGTRIDKPGGVLTAEVNVSLLWREVARLDMGRDGYAFLVDRQGKFLAFHKPATVLQRYGEDMSRLPPVAGFVRGEPQYATGGEYTGMLGEPVVGALTPIKNTEWAVVVEWPTRQAYAHLRFMLGYLAGLSLLAVLLAGTTGYFIARRLVRPVRALTKAAQRIGAGDLEALVPQVRGSDEVSLLSSSLDWMRRELARVHAGLADKVIELERAQESLALSEANFRSIFDNSIQGIFQSTPQGRILNVNQAYAKMLGYASPAQAIESLYDLGEQVYLHPEERFRFRSQLESQGQVKDFLCQFKRADGKNIWVSMNARVVADDQGGIAYFEGMLQDITARKEAEDELERKTQELDRYFTNSLDLLAILDADGFIHRLNPEWERTLGRSLEEFQGSGFLDSAHPEDRQSTMSALADLAAGKEVTSFLNRYQHMDGSYRWIEWRAFRHGKLIYAAGRNVTNRLRAEVQLRQNEERLRAILEASPHPVVVYDLDGAATFVNPAFTRVFGWEPEQLLGRRIPFVPPEFQEQTNGWIDQLLKERQTVSFETRRLTKDGKKLDIFASAAPIFDHSQQVVGIVFNLTDLTHSKRLESQLRQSQKMEAIGILAGGIAHDFNNILGAVIGFSERALTLAQSKADPTPDIGKILQAGERARDLVRQILTFSRKVEVELKPVDLNREVKHAVELLSRTLPRMITIETHLAHDLKPILANANQIELVLLNLGSNAQDAMPEGGRLAIETQNVTLDSAYCMQRSEVQPGSFVLLMVSDTGLGMDDKTKEHLFAPFFTTKEVGKGTGLGLSTVYGIVKGFGGHISCYSELGLGTTFKIYLPAYQKDMPLALDTLIPPLAHQGGEETLLLVDDEEALRELGYGALTDAGYRVLTAKSGEEALEVYCNGEHTFDLVILDLGMPGMGGHKALKAILRINPEAKVLIASGYAANGSVKEAIQSGAAGYLAKPFKLSELLSKVRNVLDGN